MILCQCLHVVATRLREGSHEPGALGGVEPFAKAHQLKTPQAQRILQSVLSYTLHKPNGRPSLPQPPWSLTETNNGKWIWWTCKHSME